MKQGDLSLLQHPVAQELLASDIPARLAYTWKDGTPRVIPIFFRWTGGELIVYSAPDAPKMKALRPGARVAVTIDTNEFPCRILMLRGSIAVRPPGGAGEIAGIAERYLGGEMANGYATQFMTWWPDGNIITIKPDWAAVIDYVERFPSFFHAAMERQAARPFGG